MNLNRKWLDRMLDFGLSYRVIVALSVLSLLSTFTEILGIGMFLPIFQFIRLEGNIDALVADSSLWKYIIDGFYYIGLELSLLPLLIVSLSLFIGRQALVYVRLVYSAAVRQRINQQQQNRVFNQYIDADTTYHDSHTVGDLVNVILTEISAAISAIMAPLELLVYFIMLATYLFILIILSWQMTLLSVIVLFLSILVPRRWIKRGSIIGRKLVSANMIMTEFLLGRLRSPRLVRLSGTAEAEKKEFNMLTLSQRKNLVIGSILQAKTNVAMDPIMVGLSFILLYFSINVLQMKIEVIGIYIIVALRLMPIVKGVVRQWQKIQFSFGSIEVVESRFRGMQYAIEKDTGVKSVIELKQSLLVSDVSYLYPAADDYALKDVTIKFKANKLTAVVGPSGSGKSTLIDMLPRLRLPTKGSIKIDGIDIEKYTLKSLRKIVSYAPQSPQMFNGTVKNHILYGKKNATNEEILEAANLAGAEEFINKLPQGFDTVLGEDAIKLSGGQRQRLDLARALVGKSKILILDEPTSNLDVESEDAFKQVIAGICNNTNTTVIIVTHRLSSILDADNIAVLNKGKIESSGTHLELLGQNGWYAKAYKMQADN